MTRPLDQLKFDIAPGADMSTDPDTWPWVSITRWVHAPVTVTHGYQSEQNTAGPDRLEFTVENDGRFTPENPLGEWFGLLDEGTPIRGYWDTPEDGDRFTGAISGLPTRWRVPTKTSMVPLVANGRMHTVARGDTFRSALHRAISRRSDVIAYWSCEDESGSNQAASPLPGVSPIISTLADFAAVDGPPGSSQLPRLQEGDENFRGQVPQHPVSESYTCLLVWRIDELHASSRRIMSLQITSPQIPHWQLNVSEDELIIRGAVTADVGGGTVFFATTPISLRWPVGGWVLAVVTLEQSLEDLDWSATVMLPEPGLPVLNTLSGTRTSTSLGRLLRVGPIDWTSVQDRYAGHITALRGVVDPGEFDAVHGFTGELAAHRLERLCGEEGMTCTIVGDPALSMPMGAQRPASLHDQLIEVAATEFGRLTERGGGIELRTRLDLCNQDAALELTAEPHLPTPPEPTRDDLRIRNVVVASRPGGASAEVRYQPALHRGRIEDSISVNPHGDARLAQLAAWRLHLATTPGMRWPSVPIRLAPSNTDLQDDWLDVRVGDRLILGHKFTQLPGVDVDLLVDGWSEGWTSHEWDVNLNCVPAAPWNVWQLEHDVFGRLHPTLSVLAEAVDESDTAWPVSTDGPPWINTTDHAAQFPFEVRVAGEVVEVTGITEPAGGDAIVGAGNMSESDTTSHVAPSVDAPAASLLVCAWCSYAQSPSTYSTPGGMTAGTLRQGDNFADMITATESVSAGATGTRTATYSSADSFSAVSIVLRGLSGAPTVEEDLSGFSSKSAGQVNPGLSLTTDPSTEAGWWLLAIHAWDWDPNDAMGDVFGGGVWTLVADSEVTTWETSRTRAWVRRVSADGAQQVTYPGASTPWDVHARLLVLSGVVDAAGQVMTVVRGVNGITKLHPAGARVELHPGHVVSL